MCNYHTLRHLIWRSHHFPGKRESENSDRNENVTLGTPFWTAKMALSKGKRENLGPKMDLKTCGERTDERRTNTHGFLKVSKFTQKPLRGKKEQHTRNFHSTRHQHEP